MVLVLFAASGGTLLVMDLFYERRRNLIPSLIAHSVNNAIVFFVALGSLKI